MTTRINAAQGVDFNAPTTSVPTTEATPDLNFQYGGDVERIYMERNTKESAVNTLKANKNNIELKIPWIGTDYIKFNGDGKMTYGQLREQLGIPPKVLSETNGKSLRDEQIVKDVRINLDDIGWYEIPNMSAEEGRDVRAQRNYGNNYAGYDRAITNDEIIKLLK